MLLSDLDVTIGEADVLLVPHDVHATQNRAKKLVILSGSTCHGSGTLLKMVILWKQRILQRTNGVECANFLGQSS